MQLVRERRIVKNIARGNIHSKASVRSLLTLLMDIATNRPLSHMQRLSLLYQLLGIA